MRCYMVEETASRLNVCRDTVFNLLKRGDLERARLHTGKRGKPKTVIPAESLGRYLYNREEKRK